MGAEHTCQPLLTTPPRMDTVPNWNLSGPPLSPLQTAMPPSAYPAHNSESNRSGVPPSLCALRAAAHEERVTAGRPASCSALKESSTSVGSKVTCPWLPPLPPPDDPPPEPVGGGSVTPQPAACTLAWLVEVASTRSIVVVGNDQSRLSGRTSTETSESNSTS